MQGSQKKDEDLGDLERNTPTPETQEHNQDNVLNPVFDRPPRQDHESTLHHISGKPPQQESRLYPSFNGQPSIENMSYLTFGERTPESSVVKKVYHRRSKMPLQKPLFDSRKKLEDEMLEWDQKIKHDGGNIKHLKALDKKLDQEIMDGQIAAQVIIDKHEKSAAALVCRMKYKTNDMSDHSLIKDVVGVVATLGTCDDARLSSILSEYLGRDTMLAVVCETNACFKSLEAHTRDGSVNKNFGIHAFAADVMGIPIEGSYEVYCLDELRSYRGQFIANDPQMKLDLEKPTLQGKTPTGFLDFAVNMVSIDNSYMYCTSKGRYTLRETLFYKLFSTLQVYESREDMLTALPVISNDAVSLDGGVIRKKGIFLLGRQKRDVDIRFSIRPRDSICKKIQNIKDLQTEQELLDFAKNAFESKNQELRLTYAIQVGGVSFPC